MGKWSWCSSLGEIVRGARDGFAMHCIARFPPHTISRRSRATTNSIKWPSLPCSSEASAMHEEPTTVIIQRYLNALPGDLAAEPVIRELLERAAGRLRLLCGTLLHKSYPRLTRPPANLETDELLGG